MNIPNYSPSEMVRIELLRYENPDGLHPIEENWRDLSRKLLKHVEELQSHVEVLRGLVSDYTLRQRRDLEWKPIKFPSKFKPETEQAQPQSNDD